MKHRWTTLLWELFAAQLLCTAAAMLPGSRVCTMPGLALPALGLAAAVPTAWFVWGVWAEPPLPLPPCTAAVLQKAPTKGSSSGVSSFIASCFSHSSAELLKNRAKDGKPTDFPCPG